MVTEFINEFINYLSVERGLANNTLLAYRRDLEKYARFLEGAGVGAVSQVSRDRVNGYMHEQKNQGLSVTSICRSLAAIKMFHRFLVRERLATEDPTNLVDTPKIWKRVPDVLSQQEVEAIIKASEGKTWQRIRDNAILELFYASGMRVSELSAVQMEHVNFEVGYVRCIGKGSKERIIPIGKRAREAILKYAQSARGVSAKSKLTQVLFLSRLRKKISRQSIWKLIKF